MSITDSDNSELFKIHTSASTVHNLTASKKEKKKWVKRVLWDLLRLGFLHFHAQCNVLQDIEQFPWFASVILPLFPRGFKPPPQHKTNDIHCNRLHKKSHALLLCNSSIIHLPQRIVDQLSVWNLSKPVKMNQLQSQNMILKCLKCNFIYV